MHLQVTKGFFLINFVVKEFRYFPVKTKNRTINSTPDIDKTVLRIFCPRKKIDHDCYHVGAW